MRSSRGFTLIELLVVIAIIGVLSSVVLASLSTAKSRANDSARISNIKSLKTVMEMYYNDNNKYPQVNTTGGGVLISTLSGYLTPNYISVIPTNLIADGDGYVSRTDGSGYAFRVKLDNMSAYGTNITYCKTGVNILPGWWGTLTPTAGYNTVPECKF